ncbi:MAG: hypothetical protein MMC33_004751 [Icmadophila ericetorum]|nr:hypothetical protein [Icmadophila ericetorum]
MYKQLVLSCIFSLYTSYGISQGTGACIQSVYPPLPQTAIRPGVSNATGYRIEDFGQGAYMVTEGAYQSLVLVSKTSIIVADAPPTIGNKLVAAIRSLTYLLISHVVYSQHHADHIGGTSLLGSPPVVTFISHRLTAGELAQVPGPHRRPARNVVFDKPNHDPGNIFIYAPVQKVLMLVDVVFPGWVPFAYLGESQNIPGYIKAHDQILAYDFNHYIGGHLDRSGIRSDVLTQKEYVNDLYKNCAAAIALSASPPNATNPISAETLIPPVIADNPGNSWAEFKIYLNTVAAYCANTINQKWLGRLGATDVFGFENAQAMIEALRIDYDVLGPFGVQP